MEMNRPLMEDLPMSHSPRGCLIGLIFVAASAIAQQGPTKAALPKPIAMPTDRAAETYRIYSSLIPLGETGSSMWPHELWLVRETTITAVPLDQPCWINPEGGKNGYSSGMNPHTAVHPPADQLQDFAEILEDFDRRCHERIALSADGWDLHAPLRLLNEDEQREFQNSRGPEKTSTAEKYKGAGALYAFSEIYFNDRHTVALVYATHWCGNLCGQGFWVALQLRDGRWKPLRWNSVSWIS